MVLTHKLFLEKEIYCVERYAKVSKEGPADFFYDAAITTGGSSKGLEDRDMIEVNQMEILNETSAVCQKIFA